MAVEIRGMLILDWILKMIMLNQQLTTDVLVLMVVALNSSWKLPISYFFIKSLTCEDKANIVRESLIWLIQINITITSVTCDGPSAHFTMFKKLGCNFDISNLRPYFCHPAKPDQKVYAIFDACHMLKLMLILVILYTNGRPYVKQVRHLSCSLYLI